MSYYDIKSIDQFLERSLRNYMNHKHVYDARLEAFNNEIREFTITVNYNERRAYKSKVYTFTCNMHEIKEKYNEILEEYKNIKENGDNPYYRFNISVAYELTFADGSSALHPFHSVMHYDQLDKKKVKEHRKVNKER